MAEVTTIGLDIAKNVVQAHSADAADAEAICEALQRPNMRMVAVKGEEQQGSALYSARGTC